MEAQSISGALVGTLRRSEPELEEVDRIIERRARDKSPRDAANERESMWKESVRQYRSEEEESFRWQWITYYKTLARNLRTRAEHFEGKAAALSAGD